MSELLLAASNEPVLSTAGQILVLLLAIVVLIFAVVVTIIVSYDAKYRKLQKENIELQNQYMMKLLKMKEAQQAQEEETNDKE